MRGPLGVLLLVWSMLQGTVIEPFVEQARTALAETREDVARLESRWRALGVSPDVTEPVDTISSVAEASLELPEEMTEAYEAVIEGSQDGPSPARGAVEEDSAYRTGNQVSLSCSAGDSTSESDVRPCSTRLRISNADPWHEEEWFYVTVLLLSADGRPLGRHTRRLSLVNPGPWTVDLVDVAERSLPWQGRATVTVHRQIAEGWKAPSEADRILVEILNPCPSECFTGEVP